MRYQLTLDEPGSRIYDGGFNGGTWLSATYSEKRITWNPGGSWHKILDRQTGDLEDWVDNTDSANHHDHMQCDVINKKF